VVKLPVLQPRQVIAALEQLGFSQIRQSGSHKQFRHSDGRGTTVPDHKGRDIAPGLLRKILDDIHVTPEELTHVEAALFSKTSSQSSLLAFRTPNSISVGRAVASVYMRREKKNVPAFCEQ